MIRSFFLKSYGRRKGVRFVMYANNFNFKIFHDQKPEPEDEVFKDFAGLEKFLIRLRELYPNMTTGDLTHADTLLVYIFQDILNRLADYRVRGKRKRRLSLRS